MRKWLIGFGIVALIIGMLVILGTCWYLVCFDADYGCTSNGDNFGATSTAIAATNNYIGTLIVPTVTAKAATDDRIAVETATAATSR